MNTIELLNKFWQFWELYSRYLPRKLKHLSKRVLKSPIPHHLPSCKYLTLITLYLLILLSNIYSAQALVAIRIPDEDLYVSEIKEIAGKVWLKTNRGIYRIDGDVAKRIPDEDLIVYEIKEIAGKVWLETDRGIYRIEEGSISVEPYSVDTWWKGLLENLLRKKVTVSGDISPRAFYSDCTGGGYPCKPKSESEFDKHFKIIWALGEESFKEKMKDGIYNLTSYKDTTKLKITSGKKEIYFSVRDKWGNQFDGMIQTLVVPGAGVLPFVGVGFWLVLLIASVAFSPVSSFCNDMIINPYLRNYGSFGIIPLFATLFSPIRRHILKRYMRSVRQDDDFSQWQERFIIPHEDFLLEKFVALLAKKRKLFLSGQSGIGKTVYFKYLMGSYASNIVALRKRLIPVFIPIARYQGENFEEMYYSQLANYGMVTDKDLTTSFLKQGGFLVFIDGLNEVDDKTRGEMNRFVDQLWKKNYFCINSQEYYQEFTWIEEIRMKTLNQEKVRELLYQRLGEAKARAVLNQFTESTYEIYKIPQNLEFAIDVVEQYKPLPTTISELYEGILAPIIDKWSEEGRLDYSNLLNERAYEMLRTKEQFFNPAKNSFPTGFLNPLAEDRKFIIPRDNNYIFRHDLVRGYLAAKYFAPMWKELLNNEEIVVDTNWREMLKFAIQSINEPDDVKGLLFAVLMKNKVLAKDLFKWLRETQPDLSQNWADEFKQRLGEAYLN